MRCEIFSLRTRAGEFPWQGLLTAVILLGWHFSNLGSWHFWNHLHSKLELQIFWGCQEKSTLRCQLEDMFQLIVTPQGIEKVTIQLVDTPTKVYAIGARLFLSKVPLEVLQNWVLIQLIVTPHVLGKVQGQIKEMCRLIEPCLLIGTREYKVLACLSLLTITMVANAWM